MRMTDLLPLEGWAAIEQEIHERFGLNARVYDERGFSFTGHTTWGNRLCPAVKASKAGLAAICSVAHTALAAEAKIGKKTVVEDCDAGLLKICVPVFKDEEFVGVVGGCGLLSPEGEIDAFMVEKAAELSEAEVESLAAGVGRMTPERVAEAVRWIEDRVAAVLAGRKDQAGWIMLRLMLLFLSAAILAALVAALPAPAQDEVMVLQGKAFGTRERPAVPFPHGRHAEGLDCTRCHHRFESGANVWTAGDATACAACHALKASGKTPGLRNAWHTLCLGCHKQELGAGKKSGFVTCGECHRRQGARDG